MFPYLLTWRPLPPGVLTSTAVTSDTLSNQQDSVDREKSSKSDSSNNTTGASHSIHRHFFSQFSGLTNIPWKRLWATDHFFFRWTYTIMLHFMITRILWTGSLNLYLIRSSPTYYLHFSESRPPASQLPFQISSHQRLRNAKSSEQFTLIHLCLTN